ncbi:MAG: 30S ribosomal protein S6 [Candidatus Marinimicrobia bacterium]|mgnify:CR=1 FL=1|jgi:small subunit ribosomal protein S6|nr:30S ribosomal protein S6 [Candidatus Neomarinimicrobiota bacterium]MBT3495751.1 30S ribosomal protein S6 [Candidatus Neomarinimicrobiota bacterium]MBT3731741.1 30S ribosomal protein S6 [Candidatus Neomarinimicrobiota bacterium]MBT4143768.1 30S ribosomal protein S6 [Candidatus Neomarinimicrobiota bacterium]MBT4177857.1 30S ribosomal protein S6 [Candidatus Neomarinimicrobiota bacterium]
MRYYETLYIVNPNFEDKKVETILAEVGGELQKTKTKVINHHVWGKKHLAYPIQKQKYGTFILMQYGKEDAGSLLEFDTWMKLNTSILRHLTTRLESEPVQIEAPVIESSKKSNEDSEASNKKEKGTEEKSGESEKVTETQTESSDEVSAEKDPVEESIEENATSGEAPEETQEQEDTAETEEADQDAENTEKEAD